MPDAAEPLDANAFWDFSARTYARPGVAEACLKLQDDLGLDVNLLLFCLWCAAEGPGRLDGGDFEQFGEELACWQAETVQPLRAIRRRSREELGDRLSTFFRAAMLRAELDAERVEQEMLFRWALKRQRAPGIDVAAEAARNLVVYLAREGVATERVAPQLRTLLAAVAEQG